MPNLHVPLEDEIWARKVEVLMRHFGSQRSKRWFTEEVFYGVMRLRGMETGGHRHAEAFYGLVRRVAIRRSSRRRHRRRTKRHRR